MEDGTLFGALHEYVIIDLFCGAGGSSAGVEMAGYRVWAAVNHWWYAIETHRKNHKDTIHYQEDVFTVRQWQASRGRRVDLLIGSPSCVHFSIARGCAPVDAGIRSHADIFIEWARDIRPSRIILENVPEFTGWGPLLPDGRPDPARKGEFFRAWKEKLEAEGYVVEWRVLRACDYGAPTSRRRLFVIARCDGQPICWPSPSHGAPGLPPHRAAAEVIDWSLPCSSIFDRRRPLAEATQRRIAEGVRRFVLDSPSPFLLQLSHGGRLNPLDAPLRTVTASPSGGDQCLIAPVLTLMAQGERRPGERRALDLHCSLPTVTSGGNRFGIAQATLEPVGAAFLSRQFGSSVGSDLGESCPTIMATGQGKTALVIAFLRKHGIDFPVEGGHPIVQIGEQFYSITDIGMRMLAPHELALAQGFPEGYQFGGTKENQIKAIGNAVVPQVMAALVRANLPAPEAMPASKGKRAKRQEKRQEKGEEWRI